MQFLENTGEICVRSMLLIPLLNLEMTYDNSCSSPQRVTWKLTSYYLAVMQYSNTVNIFTIKQPYGTAA